MHAYVIHAHFTHTYRGGVDGEGVGSLVQSQPKLRLSQGNLVGVCCFVLSVSLRLMSLLGVGG